MSPRQWANETSGIRKKQIEAPTRYAEGRQNNTTARTPLSAYLSPPFSTGFPHIFLMHSGGYAATLLHHRLLVCRPYGLVEIRHAVRFRLSFSVTSVRNFLTERQRREISPNAQRAQGFTEGNEISPSVREVSPHLPQGKWVSKFLPCGR